MGFLLDINKAAFRRHACLSITSDGQTLQIYVPSQAEVSQSQTDALIRLNTECSPATLTGRMGCGGLGGWTILFLNPVLAAQRGHLLAAGSRKKKKKLETRPIAQQAVCNKDQRNVLVTTTSLQLVGVRVPPSGPASYLPDELHNEVHHQLGVLVEHALPQLVHQSLGEVEDVVDQDLVAAAAAEGQRGVFTWK